MQATLYQIHSVHQHVSCRNYNPTTKDRFANVSTYVRCVMWDSYASSVCVDTLPYRSWLVPIVLRIRPHVLMTSKETVNENFSKITGSIKKALNGNSMLATTCYINSKPTSMKPCILAPPFSKAKVHSQLHNLSTKRAPLPKSIASSQSRVWTRWIGSDGDTHVHITATHCKFPSDSVIVTLFRFITMLCGTDNISQKIS